MLIVGHTYAAYLYVFKKETGCEFNEHLGYTLGTCIIIHVTCCMHTFVCIYIYTHR